MASAQEIEAGPIWNQADAQTEVSGGLWAARLVGGWRTTQVGRMSVCACGPARPAPGPVVPMPAPVPMQPAWRELPGLANDIGIGANGAAWVIGTNATPGGFGIWVLGQSGFTQVPGGAVRIAVGPDGQPWVVNRENAIYQYLGNAWRQLPGWSGHRRRSQRRSLGHRHAPRAGGFGIYTWNGSSWTEVPGGGCASRSGPTASPG